MFMFPYIYMDMNMSTYIARYLATLVPSHGLLVPSPHPPLGVKGGVVKYIYMIIINAFNIP